MNLKLIGFLNFNRFRIFVLSKAYLRIASNRICSIRICLKGKCDE